MKPAYKSTPRNKVIITNFLQGYYERLGGTSIKTPALIGRILQTMFLLAVVFLFAGCKKKNEPVLNLRREVVYDWQFTKQSATQYLKKEDFLDHYAIRKDSDGGVSYLKKPSGCKAF